jgi:PPOX class probable F420-dependent enzyme
VARMRSCSRITAFWLVEAMGIEPTNLLHAMQALYQLSYAPVARTSISEGVRPEPFVLLVQQLVLQRSGCRDPLPVRGQPKQHRGDPAMWVPRLAVPYHSMTGEEIRRFIRSTPARPGLLATVRADGRPHVAPVWIDLDDDGSVVFTTGAETVKGRNLRRTGRAAICVDDDRPPFSFVTLEGPVTIDDNLVHLRQWAARLGGRYMGAARAEEYGARNGVPGELLVHLHPERTASAADLSS